MSTDEPFSPQFVHLGQRVEQSARVVVRHGAEAGVVGCYQVVDEQNFGTFRPHHHIAVGMVGSEIQQF